MDIGERFQNSESLQLINKQFEDDHVYILAGGVTIDDVNFFPETAYFESFSRSKYFNGRNQ
jgi:hypothetical protein